MQKSGGLFAFTRQAIVKSEPACYQLQTKVSGYKYVTSLGSYCKTYEKTACVGKNVSINLWAVPPIIPMNSALKKLLVLALVSAAAFSSFARTPVKASVTVADLASYDSDVAHIERQFSNGGPTWTKPAPTVWSSRLEIRWNARWLATPHYAV